MTDDDSNHDPGPAAGPDERAADTPAGEPTQAADPAADPTADVAQATAAPPVLEPAGAGTEPPDGGPIPAHPPASRAIGPAWLTIVGGAIIPGLGHLLLGRRRRAALLFAPVLVLAIVAVVAVLAAPDRADLVGELLSPDALEGLVLIVAAVGLYRLIVLASTVLLAERIRPTTRIGRVGRVLLAAGLAIVVIAPHVIVGAVIADTRETILEVSHRPAWASPGGLRSGLRR